MDPVEAEEPQTEPPDEDEDFAEKDPSGRFIRVRLLPRSRSAILLESDLFWI